MESSRLSPVHRVSLWLPPLVYMAAIYRVSSEPDPLPQVTALVWDKILHTSEYAGLALLFIRALFGEGLSWPASAVIAVALSSAYGASDEWHQLFVPLRQADIHDWLADMIGATVGVVAYVGWWRSTLAPTRQ